MGARLKDIFKNEWEDFRRTSHSYDLTRPAVLDNVYKMLFCKSLWMGIQIHQCHDHPKEVRLIPCTCKSRFCPSCGYKANLIWLDGLLRRALKCDHQHLVFSLPYELRELARRNRRLIFPLMAKTMNASIKQFIHKHKKMNYLPGIVALLHTFGKRFKWHIHFHVLITAGGLDLDNKTWTENDYLNEESLKKAWKAKLLAGIRKLYRKGVLKDAYGNKGKSFLQMLSSLHDKKWYVWLKRVDNDPSFSFIYISRYAKRAPISQKGILDYREGKEIVWKERARIEAPKHCANRAHPHEFIELLIQHIPDKYEHQVFYYGLYSSYHKNRLYQVAKRILDKRAQKNISISLSLKRIKLTFSRLMRWTHGHDPLACPICGKPMQLTGIIFLSRGNPSDEDLLLNYEIKNYQLVKKTDSS